MTYAIDEPVWRVVEVYRAAGIDLAKPRAFALRLIEEAVELCFACGASAGDIEQSISEALRNEQMKDPARDYQLRRVERREEVTGEIADVVLLAQLTALSAEIPDIDVDVAAGLKISRLAAAQKDGSLYFTKDGRFYRRKPGYRPPLTRGAKDDNDGGFGGV